MLMSEAEWHANSSQEKHAEGNLSSPMHLTGQIRKSCYQNYLLSLQEEGKTDSHPVQQITTQKLKCNTVIKLRASLLWLGTLIRIWSPPRVHPKALLIIYFHDWPPTIYNLSEPTICADNTSAIISTKHFDH